MKGGGELAGWEASPHQQGSVSPPYQSLRPLAPLRTACFRADAACLALECVRPEGSASPRRRAHLTRGGNHLRGSTGLPARTWWLRGPPAQVLRGREWVHQPGRAGTVPAETPTEGRTARDLATGLCNPVGEQSRGPVCR